MVSTAGGETQRSDPDEIARIFAVASDLDEEARDELLSRECAGRLNLRREVESLLAASEVHGRSFLEPVVDRASSRSPSSEARAPAREAGSLVGPYRLLEVLGRGGMGTVYRAVRVEGGFDQQVALKLANERIVLPRVAHDSDAVSELEERLLQERRILARLQHPNIARLLDGGIDEGGHAWFAMELVRGCPIDEACDRVRATVKERVAAMVAVCRAVESAHGRLVIHRDLKPSNVLVEGGDAPTATHDASGHDVSGRVVGGRPLNEGERALGDGAGGIAESVRIVDFGIAKLLDGAGEGAADLTRTGLSPHTPGYAAPEQVRGERSTVATDVHALGLILHELLTGRRPERRSVTGAVSTLERPSSLVLRPLPGIDGDETAAETIAEARCCSPDGLSRRIRGDLEAILQQALEEEPERRYAGAGAMADDLERFLDGLPVRARPATLPYRLGKHLRRHWALVAMAALTAVVVLVGLATSVWLARVASAERDRAQRSAAEAQKVQELLVEVFSQADPNTTRGEEVGARELLERGLEVVGSRDDVEPAVRATLFESVAGVFKTLNDLERMEEVAAEAVELRRSLSPDGSADLAQALQLLATARYRLGRQEQGEELHREAISLLRADPKTPPLELAGALNSLAVTLHGQFEYQEAEQAYREARRIRSEMLGAEHASTATVTGNLGLLMMDVGQFEEADELLEQAQRDLRAAYGDDHTVVANNLVFYGKNRRAMGDLDGAERAYREALDVYRRLLGEGSVLVGRTLASLSNVLYDRGDFEDAVATMERSIELQRASLGPRHINVGAALLSHGAFLARLGRFEEALAATNEAISIRLSQGTDDLVAIRGLIQRGVLERHSGELQRARSSLTETLDALRAHHGDGHALAAGAYRHRALAGLLIGDHPTARDDAAHALAIVTDLYGEGHPSVAGASVLVGEIEMAAGRSEAGCEQIANGLVQLEEVATAANWMVGAARSARGECLQRLGGDPQEARRLLVSGHDILHATLGEHHDSTRRAWDRLNSNRPSS